MASSDLFCFSRNSNIGCGSDGKTWGSEKWCDERAEFQYVENSMKLPAEIYETTVQDIIVQEFGFFDYSIDIMAGAAIGDNYMGDVYRIVVTDNESGQCKNIILKVPPQSISGQDELHIHKLFMKEIAMYEKVLQMFAKFQDTKGIYVWAEGFHEYPDCYRSLTEQSHEAVYMEDLKQTGFEMFSRFEEPTFDHARLLMETLGKFHAISFAIKDQAIDCFAEYTEWKDLLEGSYAKKISMIGLIQLQKAIDCLDPEKHSEIIKKCQRILNDKSIAESISECVNGQTMEQYSVICHGDCWNNNMLYKKDKNGDPTEIRLVDYQISRYASPALDLLFYTFCSTHKTLRDNHYEDLLKIYHNSLTTFLTRLGSDADKIFPFSALQSELKRVGKFGLIMSAIIVPITIQSCGKRMEMNEMADKDFKPSIITENSFTARMRDILLDLDKYGYLD